MRTLFKVLLCAFFLFVALIPSNVDAQSKFVQPGAKWNYTFKFLLLDNTYGITCSYISDTIIAGDTCHNLYTPYIVMNSNECNNNKASLLKQKGDTIFFKNATTQGSWQILYNFATPVGQTWLTKIKPEVGPSQTLIAVVDSAYTRVINGVNLKHRVVRYFGGPRGVDTMRITERLGSSKFLFNFYIPGCISDWEEVQQFLCYTDNQIGTYQLTSYPCNYKNPRSLDAISPQTTLHISPNPSSDVISIQGNFHSFRNKQIQILNVLGQVQLQLNLQSNQQSVSIIDFPKGIYTIQILEGTSILDTKKLLVDR